MAWTTGIFGALLLSGLVWIANDIFHLKAQLMETDRQFDGINAQMTALGGRIDDLNIAIEQLGAELVAGRNTAPSAPATGPEVSILSTPTQQQNLQAAANAQLANPQVEATALDAAVQPQQPLAVQPQQQAALAPAAVAPAPAPAPVQANGQPLVTETGIIPPSPPAPRDQLTPEELAAPAPVIAAVAPAAEQPAQPQAAASTEVAAAAPAPAAPAPAASAPAAGANLSDDQLLSFNDEQIDPADELLLLDENGNPQ
jgi:hypothetical protein